MANADASQQQSAAHETTHARWDAEFIKVLRKTSRTGRRPEDTAPQWEFELVRLAPAGRLIEENLRCRHCDAAIRSRLKCGRSGWHAATSGSKRWPTRG